MIKTVVSAALIICNIGMIFPISTDTESGIMDYIVEQGSSKIGSTCYWIG